MKYFVRECLFVFSCVSIAMAILASSADAATIVLNPASVKWYSSSNPSTIYSGSPVLCTKSSTVTRSPIYLFDLPSLPHPIISATLELPYIGSTQSGASNVRIRRMVDDWQSNWSQVATYLGNSVPAGTITVHSGGLTCDVTDCIQLFADGTTNYGLCLRNVVNSSNLKLGGIYAPKATLTIEMACAGDANLDGHFNSSDLVAVFQAGKYETMQPATWAEGDWNGDGVFDSGDLVAAFQDGCYEDGDMYAFWASL